MMNYNHIYKYEYIVVDGIGALITLSVLVV